MEHHAANGVWASRRAARLVLGVSACAAGGVLGAVLEHKSSLSAGLAIFAISLAALVGAGKFASP